MQRPPHSILISPHFCLDDGVHFSIRLKHRVFVTRSQSHPRRITGDLTVPQAAAILGISPHWFYDRIKKGVIGITRDQSTGLYLFPDTPQTLDQFRGLQAGNLNRLSFKRRSENESQE